MDQPQNAYRLEVTSATAEGVTVVSVSGEIDHTSAGPLVHALEPDAVGEQPRVIVDMRQVSFMDSTGINVLLTAHRNLAKAGGWLRLADLQASVMRILDIVGVDHILPCYPNLPEALAV
ncbi:STAS domain-containing protein [Streptomyces sp900105245]|uniref:Anti-sigma factor antagonist n=1 Tax=Streptomyces sp. 900105245 TaxID=3154379 RepID=A0ABV1ULH2_9ACTN